LMDYRRPGICGVGRDMPVTKERNAGGQQEKKKGNKRRELEIRQATTA